MEVNELQKLDFISFIRKIIKGDIDYTAEQEEVINTKAGIYFHEIEKNSTSIDFKIELSRFVDCIWELDKVLEKDKKNENIRLYQLRDLLLNKYDQSLERTYLRYTDVNKHFLFDKTKFYDIIEQQKKAGFPLKNAPIEINSNNNLPKQSEDFVGRKNEAIEVIQKLTENHKTSLCISGVVKGDNGGIGKTTLAVEIAHFLTNTKIKSYKDNLKLLQDLPYKQSFFKDGVIWIRISSTEHDINIVLEDIAKQIGYLYLYERAIHTNQKTTKQKDKYGLETSGDVIENFEDNRNNEKTEETEEIEEIEENETQKINFSTKNIVRSLEEIAIILHDKNVIVVIDNAEQNKQIFDYIFPRLNTFTTILITSRYPTPGIQVVPIGNLNTKDSVDLFCKNLSEKKKKRIEYNSQKEKIEELCFKLLDGHPLSINLVAHSENLIIKGLDEFNSQLFQVMQGENHKTYRKILALLQVGDILSINEKEALIRASANFKSDFTVDKINGFCVYDEVETSVLGLYSKGIISPKQSENTFIVQQVFKDYALEELLDICFRDFNNFFETKIKDITKIENYIYDNKRAFDLKRRYDLDYNEKLWLSSNACSFLLASHEPDETVLNFILNKFIGLVSKSEKKLSVIATMLNEDYYNNKNWLLYLECHHNGLLAKYDTFFLKFINNKHLLHQNKSLFQIHNLSQTLSELLIDFGFLMADDIIFEQIQSKLKKEIDHIECYDSLLYSVKMDYMRKINPTDEISYFKTRINIFNEYFINPKSNNYYYYSDLLGYKAEKLNQEITTQELDTLVQHGKQFKIRNFEETIYYYRLLNCFNKGEYSKFIEESIKQVEFAYTKKKIFVIRLICLVRQNEISEAKQVLNAYIKKHKEYFYESLVLITIIKLFADNSEWYDIIDLLGIKKFILNELNINENNQENIPVGKLKIPSSRGFYNTENMFLLDTEFMLDRMKDIREEGFHNEIKNFDSGFYLYPYYIDEKAVSEEDYKTFCLSTGKKYNIKEFNINDALQYVEYIRKQDGEEWKMATEEEWISAFRNFNYNVSVPQTVLSLLEEEKPIIKEYRKLIGITVFEKNNADEIYQLLIPNNLFTIIRDAKSDMEIWEEIKDEVNQVIENNEFLLETSDNNILKLPISLLKLIAYSPTIHLPELKLRLLEKLKSSDKEYKLKAYKLLLLDFCEMYFIDDKRMLLRFVNQRNAWKIAVKLFLGIEKFHKKLEFTNQIEMVHRIKDDKDYPIYKRASKGRLHSTEKKPNGYVPFRCVRILPLLSDKLKLS